MNHLNKHSSFTAQADSTTAVNPVHITHSQSPSTTNTHVSKGTSSLSFSHQRCAVSLRCTFLLKSVPRYIPDSSVKRTGDQELCAK